MTWFFINAGNGFYFDKFGFSSSILQSLWCNTACQLGDDDQGLTAFTNPIFGSICRICHKFKGWRVSHDR